MIQQIDSIVTQSKERSAALGLDPDILPTFSQRLSPNDLQEKVIKYEEVLDVVKFFLNKFLSTVEGTPFLALITDEDGHILRLSGDSTIVDTVNQLGIIEGVRFIEEDAGVNSVSLALLHNQPIQLIGEDHYHKALHSAACYSVPLHNKDNKQLIGTITLFTIIPFGNPLFLAMLCTIVDSIERELQVREKNNQLYILNEVLLQTSYQAVIVTNTNGEIIEWNDKGQQILKKLSHAKLIDKGSSIFHVEKIGSFFNQVALTQHEYIGEDLQLVMEGTLRYFILDVVPIFNDRKSMLCIVGSLRDISDMKNTEDQLRNAEKLSVVGQMAAGVAHEIRNPLTTVKGLLQLFKDQFKPDHYNLIMSEIDRMNLIVSELLVLGKPNPIQYVEVDCLSILNEIVQLFETQARMNGISITRDVRDYGYIYCDPNQIKQVFVNILKNAMEAMPYGGDIQVVLDTNGTEQLIRFKDNGEGMSEDMLNKIGQPFCTTRKNGNGLGIMVTKKIIESH
ncbi:MAG TPA: ATP-binding protein, partial [Bacillota bacterium]|nr:ATP-binding protein [Bacillota bacterium]